MAYLAELQVSIRIRFEIVRICRRVCSKFAPHTRKQQRLDDDYRLVKLRYAFWVHRRRLFWSGKLSPIKHSRCCKPVLL